jgi:hypothetical protein
MGIFSKVLITSLIFILLCQVSYGEKLPSYPYVAEYTIDTISGPVVRRPSKTFNPVENPLAYPYFEDYAMRLWEAFDARKGGFWWYVGGCTSNDFEYYLYSDGTISDIKIGIGVWEDVPSEEYLGRFPKNNPTRIMYSHALNTIKSLSPKPFPKGLKEEKVEMKIGFCKTKYDKIRMNYSPTVGKDEWEKIQKMRREKWLGEFRERERIRGFRITINKDPRTRKSPPPKPRPTWAFDIWGEVNWEKMIELWKQGVHKEEVREQ